MPVYYYYYYSTYQFDELTSPYFGCTYGQDAQYDDFYGHFRLLNVKYLFTKSIQTFVSQSERWGEGKQVSNIKIKIGA